MINTCSWENSNHLLWLFNSDIDECASHHECSHLCINTPGTFHCVCETGYQLAGDKRQCQGMTMVDYFKMTFILFWRNLFCLVVICVPSTARSFRDGPLIYCPFRRTWSSVFTPFPPGIEPRSVAWQSNTLPLRHASSTEKKNILNFI